MAAIAVLMALISGCSLGLAGSASGTMILRVDDRISKSLILPEIDMNPAAYLIEGEGPNDASFSQEISPGTSSLRLRLLIGEWDMTVTALNEAGEAIGEGAETVTILENKTVDLSITVVPFEGNGELSLALSWNVADYDVTRISATLTPSFEGQDIIHDFSLDSYNGTATLLVADLPAGYYTMSVSLKNADRHIVGTTVIVRIVAGQRTSGSLDLGTTTHTHGSVSTTIRPRMSLPLKVAISGGHSQKPLDRSMNLFARTLDSDSNAAIDYHWFVNGLPVQSSDSLSLGTDMAEGSYIVDLVALDSAAKRAGSSSLVVTVTGTMGDVGAIANPSVETANAAGTKPTGWTFSAWGAASSAVSTYLNEGHSGTKSLKAEIVSAISGDGDAKWAFDPVSLAPGEHYVFSHYYRSDIDTQVKVAIVHEDLHTSYINLPAAPKSTEWKEYRATFTMPDTGKTATVYHLIAKKGWLVTDDYSIYPHDYTGFDRGMVSLSFDDGWNVNTTTALPLMQEFGFHSTQFYATTFIRNYSSTAEAKTLINKFIAAGHEIGSHSESHRDLSTVPESELPAEITGSKQYLETLLGVEVKVMAAPFGGYNTKVLESIMATYDAQRSVDEGYNDSEGIDLSRLKVQNIRSTTTKAEVEAWLTRAREDHTWLILVYHDIDTRKGDYILTPAVFRQHLEAIRDSELSVLTISEALQEAGLI